MAPFTTLLNDKLTGLTFRALTPQVSYMKAIDLWVLICLLLTFTCLAEYGIILHMTSRSGWQKKMDEYVRTVSGKPKLRKVSAMEMGPLSLRKHDRRMSIDRCGGKYVLIFAVFAQFFLAKEL